MSPHDHPEWRAFVEAIRTSPDDDTPRLAAADWLQEHGRDEWAEFVRVQCALAADRDAPGECSPGARCGECVGCGLRARERELLGTPREWFALPAPWGVVWNGPAGPPSVGDVSWWGPDRDSGPEAFSVRGFIQHVVCWAEEWPLCADRVTRTHPVRRVTLSGADEAFLTAHAFAVTRTDGRSAWTSPEWPGVEFDWTEHGQIPLDGWTIRMRQAAFSPGEQGWTRWVLAGSPRGDLVAAARGSRVEEYRHLVGRRFGPVAATDGVGGRWRCEAILTELRLDEARQVTVLEAVSAGEIVAALVTDL